MIKFLFPGLCKLSKLVELDLAYNKFEGTLPPCLNNLTSLQLLDLSGNEFTGNISSSWIASQRPLCLNNLSSLRLLDLFWNNFTGNVPSSLVPSLTSLQYIILVIIFLRVYSYSAHFLIRLSLSLFGL